MHWYENLLSTSESNTAPELRAGSTKLRPAEVEPEPRSTVGQQQDEQAFMQQHNYAAAPVVTKHLIKELRALNKVPPLLSSAMRFSKPTCHMLHRLIANVTAAMQCVAL